MNIPGLTRMFRNQHQLDVIIELIKEKLKVKSKVKIHIFACSTGQEAFSMAITLAEKGLLDRVELHASDYNANSIEIARNAKFGRKDYYQTPVDIRKKYFKIKAYGNISLDEKIINSIKFSVVDLFQIDSSLDDVDFGFVQNCTIHLTEQEEEKIINSVNNHIIPDGYFIISGCHIEHYGKVLKNLRYIPIVKSAEEIHEGWIINRKHWDQNNHNPSYWAIPPFQKVPDWEWKFVSIFKKSLA